MDFTSLVTAAFRRVYRRFQPRSPGERRPRLVWFPKYRTTVQLPARVLLADEPFRELEALVGGAGFSLDSWTPDAVHYRRGRPWGDFSIRLIGIRVSFATPLTAECAMTVVVSDVCLFDTGDLWLLTQELRDLIQGSEDRLDDGDEGEEVASGPARTGRIGGGGDSPPA